MYLEEREVQKLFNQISIKFQNIEILIELMSMWMVNRRFTLCNNIQDNKKIYQKRKILKETSNAQYIAFLTSL